MPEQENLRKYPLVGLGANSMMLVGSVKKPDK
jgi:hypothetical protein